LAALRLPTDRSNTDGGVKRSGLGWGKTSVVAIGLGTVLCSIYEVGSLSTTIGMGAIGYLIPVTLEGVQLLCVVLKWVAQGDIDAAVPRAAAGLEAETAERLVATRKVMEARAVELRGSVDAAGLRAEANQAQRRAAELEEVERAKFKATKATMAERARLAAERELEIERLIGDAEFARRKFDTDMVLMQIEADTAAMAASAAGRAELAAVKQDELLALDRDRHEAAIGKERKKSRLLPTGGGGDANPKADATMPMPVPVHGLNGANGMNGSS